MPILAALGPALSDSPLTAAPNRMQLNMQLNMQLRAS
jgi:hypothetical protein